MATRLNLSAKKIPLDALICVLSQELSEQHAVAADGGPQAILVRQMQEALHELLLARGLRRMLLSASCNRRARRTDATGSAVH
jgi:hypothetical protein